MSWKAFSDLMWGISDLCFKLYNQLPAEENHSLACAIVATDSIGTMRWVAVHPSHARAFKAAYPAAGTIETFNAVIQKWKRTNPAYVVYLEPFIDMLCEAVDAYPHCQIFVMAEK